AKHLPKADPIHKVTIIPRGRALGITQQLPLDDRHTYSREYLLTNVAILMGGRVAEELVLNIQTTGAGNDIERATEIARKMVCVYGMSKELGPLTFGRREEQIFLGKELAVHRDYSEATSQKIDKEVEEIVMEGYERAKMIISRNMEQLHELASALLEKETLEGKEIDELLGIATKDVRPEEGSRV
ncbi:MAG: cell division protein FtsH, partial [Desulfatiglandales bacterium]